jgi:hypothetical protein
MTIRYFYADSYICIKAFAIHLISNEVCVLGSKLVVVFKQERESSLVSLKCCSWKRGKHLVGGTERALLLEELGLLLSDLLVDLGTLAGLVAVGSGLDGVLACSCMIMDSIFNVQEG